MSAVNNGRQVANRVPDYDALAKNLSMDNFVDWAGTGAKADCKRRLVLNNQRILNAAGVRGDILYDRTGGTRDQKKRENVTARQVFLKVVMRECKADSVEKLPYSVRVAMKLEKEGSYSWQRDDWKVSKALPLSARRVEAVSKAVRAYKADMDGKTESIGMGKGWLNAPEHKEFWYGLDKGLRHKLLSNLTGNCLKKLWDGYAKCENDNAKRSFITKINNHYSACGKKASVPIPVGDFSIPNESATKTSPGGKALAKFLSKKSAEYTTSQKIGAHHPKIVHALKGLFQHGKSCLNIKYQPKGGNTNMLVLAATGDGGFALCEGVDGKELKMKNYVSVDSCKNYGELTSRLCEITGLNEDELCILLSKTVPGGGLGENCIAASVRHFGLDEGEGAFKVKDSSGRTTITVNGPRNFSVSQVIDGDVESFGKDARGKRTQLFSSGTQKLDVNYNYTLPPAVTGKVQQQQIDIQNYSIDWALGMRRQG